MATPAGAHSAEETLRAADELGYPVALKIESLAGAGATAADWLLVLHEKSPG